MGEMQDKQTFEQWWDENHFYTATPLYQIYRRLHVAGANLSFVDFLCHCLRLGDGLLTPVRQARAVWRAKLKRERSKEWAVLRRLGPLESKKELENLQADRPTLIAEQQEKFRQLEKYLLRFRKLLGFSLILHEYGWSQLLQRRGRNADTWGSFFLLALTEHLKTIGGKPRHHDADRLLRLARQSLRPNSDAKVNGKSRAAVRIAELKANHPDWSSALKLLELQSRIITGAMIERLIEKSSDLEPDDLAEAARTASLPPKVK